MEAFALYLLKSTVWLTGFLLIYMLFLRNERFFVLNRIYLVFGILASILFPLFTWRYTVILPVTPTVDVLEPEILGAIPATVTVPEPFPIQNLLLYFYLTGALFLLFRLIKQSVSVWNVIRQSETYHFKSVKLIRTDRYPTSFSFFSFVFVNPSIDEPETSEIVNHEHEHIRQQHWMDLLLFEIFRTMHWFNPVSWLYGRLIRQNHEYLADERALQRTSNPAIYRAALLNQMFGGPVISLANSFNYSINKKRFKMMTKTIHSPFRKLKLLLALPLIAGVFYAFAAPEYKFVPVENESALAEAAPTGSELIAAQIGALLAQTTENQTNSLQSQPTEGKTIQGQAIPEDNKPKKSASVVVSGKSTGTFIDASGKHSQPGLVIVDGKEIPSTETGKVNPGSIESISALKGESAIRLYGEKGKDGVVIITTKKGQTSDNQSTGTATDVRVAMGYPINQSAQQSLGGLVVRGTGTMSGATPLYVIDGVVSESQNAQEINPNSIQSINVLNGESAIRLYGEKAKDGVVIITTKKGQTSDNQSTGAATEIQVVGYGKNQPAQQSLGGITVRGRATPLIVIDGVVSESGKMDINPNNIQSMNSLSGESATQKYGEKAKDGAIEITLKKGVTSDQTSGAEVKVIGYASQQGGEEVFVQVEEMPEFPGGIAALSQYLASSVKYPVIAQQNGIQGKVYVNFVINKDGSVSDARISRSVDPSLDAEALRVVSSLPKWKPGKQRGELVRVSYTVPINFQLLSNQTTASSEKTIPGEEVYVVVDQMPEFPGGIKELTKYLATSVKYPAIAKENGIQGKVYVNFVVNKDGSVSNFKIARVVDPLLDAEAMRVVSSLPKWIPGKHGGEPVRVSYTVPVTFQLQPEAASVIEKKATTPSAGQNITVESKRLIIVPNPANNQATITAENMTEAGKLDVSIFDRNGKRIKAEQKTGPTFNLSISDLTNGTYIISANDGKDQYSGQLVVVH